MSFTRNILEKRGTWRRFGMPAGFSPDAIYADRRGLIWFSQSGDSSATVCLGCFDGLHTRNVLAELNVDVPLQRVGFSGDDQWWGITKAGRLLSVDLKDRTLTDCTALVPDLSKAYWLWTTHKNSDIVIGIPNKLVRLAKQNATLIDAVFNAEGKVHGVAFSPSGELWFTSDTGLYRYDGKEARAIRPANLNANLRMWELLVSHGDVAWVATPGGILRVEGGSCSLIEPELESAAYSALIEDDDGNVWLLGSDVAVSCVTPHGVVNFSTEDGLSSLLIACATQDRQKRIWFACKGVGLCMYDPETFFMITPHGTNATCNSDKGVFLATPMNGLLHWDEVALTIVNKTIACGSYSAICRGPAGQLLLKSARRLYEVDLETMQSRLLRGRKEDAVYGAICDRNGVVWIATSKLIVRCEGVDEWQSTYSDLGLHRFHRNSFLEFSRGVLVLTRADHGGLYYFDGKEPKWLECLLPGDNPMIVCGCEDSQKRLWLATVDGPVFCFDGTSTREVLPDGQSIAVEATCILEDTRGVIWFGTTKGIVKYDGQAYQQMTTAYGLPEDHVKGINLLSNGDIIIATIRGVYSYHPCYEAKPFLTVTHVVTNVTHDATTMVNLHAGIPAVTIQYEGSSTKMGHLKYLYRLEGYEAGWRETWDEYVRYEGLPAGLYIFHIKAVDVDFMYSDEAPPVTLHVAEDPSKKTIENLKTQLESTQDFSENIIRSIRDAIIVADQCGSIAVVNDAALDLTGHTRNELIGMPAATILSPDCQRLLDNDGIRHILDDGMIRNRECTLLASGDKHVPALLSASVMGDRAGQVQGIVITARDLTSYKEMQQRLQQKHKMESLGALASGVAHDFNNLMSVVIGYAEMMRDDLPAGYRGPEYLTDIETAAKHAASLCTDLLNFAGKALVVNKEVDLTARITELVRLLRASISRKIVFDCSLDPALPTILADDTRITQVILNLLTNAAQAIGDVPGTISVSARAAHLDANDLRSPYTEDIPKPGRFVILEIEDTGCGINPDKLEHIFDPFFTTKATGRGLGLATVKGIVHGHHGALQVRSKPGAGTTFTVCLPAHAGAHQQADSRRA